MKLAETLISISEELDKKILNGVVDEVKNYFFADEFNKFRKFDDFFSEVKTQNKLEKNWDANKYEPYYKKVWDMIKSNKLKLN